MSDDNSRDRPGSAKATQAGPLPTRPGKRGAAARTMLGLPVMDPSQAQRIARAGISGYPPAGSPPQRSAPAPAPVHAPAEDLAESDTRYMDPPSEALGRAQTEAVPQTQSPFAPAAEAAPPSAVALPSAPEPGSGLFGSTLQRSRNPQAQPKPAGAGLFGNSLSAMHDPEAPKPGAPRTHFTNNQAPEAWRDDVRRMAERAPAAPRPKVQPGPTASLRLKLDGDPYEEQPYRAPKSALPKVLLWLVILGLVGGGAAYYAEGHGGVNAVVNRLRGVSQPAAPAQPAVPPSAANQAAQPAAAANPVEQQPPAAAAPTGQQPAAAAPAAQPAAAAPSAAPPTSAPATDDSARQLADPDAPQEQPAAAQQAPAAARPTAPVAKKPEPKPKAAPKAPVRRHEPVVKVRPLDGSGPSAPGLDTPPTPSDMPYVPVPGDPPAPDEPR